MENSVRRVLKPNVFDDEMYRERLTTLVDNSLSATAEIPERKIFFEKDLGRGKHLRVIIPDRSRLFEANRASFVAYLGKRVPEKEEQISNADARVLEGLKDVDHNGLLGYFSLRDPETGDWDNLVITDSPEEQRQIGKAKTHRDAMAKWKDWYLQVDKPVGTWEDFPNGEIIFDELVQLRQN